MERIPARGDFQYFDNAARAQELVRPRKRVEEFENGEAIVKEKKNTDKWRRKYERECAARKKDAEKARRETKSAVKVWQQAADDVYADYLEQKVRADKLTEELRTARAQIKELEKSAGQRCRSKQDSGSQAGRQSHKQQYAFVARSPRGDTGKEKA